MTLADPLVRLNSDCVFSIFECLTPPDVLQCTLVSKPWRDSTHSWIKTVGFRAHYSVDLPDGECVDEIGAYKQYARQDTNLVSGRPTSVQRLEAYCTALSIAGRYVAWASADLDKVRWRFRSPSPVKKADGAHGDRGALLMSTTPDGISQILLSEHGHILVEHAWSDDLIYYLPDIEGESKRTGKSIPCGELDTEEPSYDSFVHKAVGRQRIYSIDHLEEGSELTAHDWRTGEVLYHMRYPDDEPALADLDINPSASELPVVTLDDGSEVLLQTQVYIHRSNLCKANIIDGATGVRLQRLTCGVFGYQVLQALPPQRRGSRKINSFRVVGSRLVRNFVEGVSYPLLLVIVLTYTDEPNGNGTLFARASTDAFLFPSNHEHPSFLNRPNSVIGFTMTRGATSSEIPWRTIKIFHPSQSFDPQFKERIDNALRDPDYDWYRALREKDPASESGERDDSSYDGDGFMVIDSYFNVTNADMVDVAYPNTREDGNPEYFRCLGDGTSVVIGDTGRRIKILDFD